MRVRRGSRDVGFCCIHAAGMAVCGESLLLSGVALLRITRNGSRSSRISLAASRGVVVVLALIFLHATRLELQAKSEVIFTSPCACEGNHGVSRWAAKTETTLPPANAADIQSLTPADMFSWQGIGGGVTKRSPRLIAEQKWFSVTGRVEEVRVEDDGDVHVVMKNTDARAGGIIVELPLGEPWCEMRKTVFSWTNARFPISVGRTAKLKLHQHPVVTVVGKAFYDIDHSHGDARNNRRDYDPSLAVWEIHPVMRLGVGTSAPISGPVSAPTPSPVSSPIASTIPSSSKTAEQFVTIAKPITIQVPYGTTVLQPGMQLPILSRDAQTVDVRYMDARYTIPLSSTNLK